MPDEDDEILPDAADPATEMPDASDPRQQKRIRNKGKRETEEARQFWTTVLADPIGRREIWRLLNDAHTFETRFATGPNGFPQPLATWFHAGEQAWGQRFYQTLAIHDRAGVLALHDEFDDRFGKVKRIPAPRQEE